MDKLAPIVLFVYKRPEHTLKTLSYLKKNELAAQSALYIYADGPKTSSKEELQQIAEVRGIIRQEQWCKEVHILESGHNLGLSQSIITGITNILNKYGKIIVLEDDIVISKHFLQYMNEALQIYEKKEEVISISGYTYPVTGKLPETFFIKGADCWGWGTWQRAWNLFNPDGKELLNQLKKRKLTYKFDYNGSFPCTQMLKDQISGKNDCWAVRWHAAAHLNNKFTLYPGVSLVNNIGNDNTGTHKNISSAYEVELKQSPVILNDIKIKEDSAALSKISDFFSSSNPKKSALRNLIKRIINFF